MNFDWKGAATGAGIGFLVLCFIVLTSYLSSLNPKLATAFLSLILILWFGYLGSRWHT